LRETDRQPHLLSGVVDLVEDVEHVAAGVLEADDSAAGNLEGGAGAGTWACSASQAAGSSTRYIGPSG